MILFFAMRRGTRRSFEEPLMYVLWRTLPRTTLVIDIARHHPGENMFWDRKSNSLTSDYYKWWFNSLLEGRWCFYLTSLLNRFKGFFWTFPWFPMIFLNDGRRHLRKFEFKSLLLIFLSGLWPLTVVCQIADCLIHIFQI